MLLFLINALLTVVNIFWAGLNFSMSGLWAVTCITARNTIRCKWQFIAIFTHSFFHPTNSHWALLCTGWEKNKNESKGLEWDELYKRLHSLSRTWQVTLWPRTKLWPFNCCVMCGGQFFWRDIRSTADTVWEMNFYFVKPNEHSGLTL